MFVALGGNFLSAMPDTNYTSEAMARCRLTVQIATKLNRGHLITGAAGADPALPRTHRTRSAGSGEQFVSVEDTTGVVHQSRGVLAPGVGPAAERAGHRGARLALATLAGKTTVDWAGVVDDYDRIRDHIEHVVPGFTQYNQRVRQPGGFYLPNGPREGTFPTAVGARPLHRPPDPRARSDATADCC